MAVQHSKSQEEALKKRADEAAMRAIQSMTPGALFAFQLVARNLKNGVFWGFTTMEEVKKHADDIRQDGNLRARKVGAKDCIIEVVPEYIFNNIVSILPEAFSPNDVQKMQENMGSAVVEFEKFLINKGISNPGFGATIGIYSTNNVTSISYKGYAYPAFRLNMDMALNLLAHNGYQVKVGGVFINAVQAINSQPKLWESTQLSPTKTGVFINVKSTFSPDQLKKCRERMKQKYGEPQKPRRK